MEPFIKKIDCRDAQYAIIRVAFGRKVRFGIIDLDGNFILDPMYSLILKVSSFDNRYYYVYDDEKRKVRYWDAQEQVFLDKKTGKSITEVNTENGVRTLTFRKGHRYGICNEDGSIIIPAQWHSIEAFGQDYVAVGNNGVVFLDSTGEVLIPEIYDELMGSFFYSYNLEVIDYDYAYNWRLLDHTYDLIPARLSDDWFYVDRCGNRISERTYAAVGLFTKEGYAIIRDKNGISGVIDKNENLLVAGRYDYLSWRGKNLLFGIFNGKSFLMNLLGKILLRNIEKTNYNIDCAIGQYHNHLATWRWKPDTGKLHRYDFIGYTTRSFSLLPTKDYVEIIQYAHTIQHADYTLVQQDGKPLFKRFYDGIDTSANPDRIFVKDGKKWYLMNAKEEIIKEIEYPDLERL